MGLWRGKLAQRLITPASALFGCILGLISVIVYAIIQAPHWGVSNNEALHSVFLGATLDKHRSNPIPKAQHLRCEYLQMPNLRQ